MPFYHYRTNKPVDPMAGIHFLDEPTPPPTTSPTTPTTPPPIEPKRSSKRERPIGLLTFLAVVGIGLAVKLGGDSLPLPTTAEESVSRSFLVDSAPLVIVETFNGPIEVIRGEPGQVDCRVQTQSRGFGRERAEANLTRLGVGIRREADVIRVAVSPGQGGKFRDAKGSVTLLVPENATLHLTTRNGKVKVQGVEGPIQARTSNGPIEVQGASGIVSLESSNGRIKCAADQAIVSLETSNGPIDFQGSLVSGLSTLKTSNGKITLRLPEDQVFHLDAQGKNKDGLAVSSEFDNDYARQAALIGDVGPASGVVIKARTSNGSVRVLRSDR